MISILLMRKIAELFFILFAAFFLVRFRLLSAEDSRGISRLCLFLIFPCMVVNCFLIDRSPETDRSFLIAVAVAFAMNVLFLLMGRLVRRFTPATPVEIASLHYTNVGNLMIPLVQATLGPERLLYLTPFVAVQIVFVWTHLVSLFHPGEKLGLRKILLNVNVFAIVIGLFLFLTGLRPPAPVTGALSSVAAMAGPCGMMVTGMLLAQLDFRSMFRRRLLWTVLARMLLWPAVVLLLAKGLLFCGLFPGGETVLLICLLAAAAPAASTVTQFSQIYGQDAVYASMINVSTTLLCIVTLPAFVWLFERL